MSIYLEKPTNPKSTAIERSCITCKRIFYTSKCDLKYNRAKYCTKECKDKLQRGQNHVRWKPKAKRICTNCKQEFEIENWRLKETNRGKFCSSSCSYEFRVGENAANWRGGLSKENHKLRYRKEVNKWREEVLIRDEFTCVWCGSKENVEVDHIKSWADYPDLRTDVNNGRVLCRSCHITTFTKEAQNG